jgi:hypothetical protein
MADGIIPVTREITPEMGYKTCAGTRSLSSLSQTTDKTVSASREAWALSYSIPGVSLSLSDYDSSTDTIVIGSSSSTAFTVKVTSTNYTFYILEISVSAGGTDIVSYKPSSTSLVKTQSVSVPACTISSVAMGTCVRRVKVKTSSDAVVSTGTEYQGQAETYTVTFGAVTISSTATVQYKI